MELTEEQVYSALGVEPAGANEPETAEPATEETVTEPVETGATEPETAEPVETETTPEQSIDERRQQAAERRRRETQAAIDEAVAKARAEEQNKAAERQKEFFAKAGLKNSITGEDITDMEGFDNWKAEFDRQRAEKDLRAGRLSRETLDTIISDNPIMKRAQEMVQAADQQAQQARTEADKAEIDRQIAEIGKINPEIQGIGDILAMDTAEKFTEYVRKGNNFVDSYYLANRENMQNATATAAKQAAMNNIRGKNHLSATTQQGAGSMSVPNAELRMFREFMPGASDAEIQAYYNKYKKSLG